MFGEDQKSIGPELFDRVRVVIASVPILLIHVCRMAVDHNHFVLWHVVASQMGMLEIRLADDIHGYAKA